MNPIAFAVVGCGNIGTRHMAILDADPDTQLVAYCDDNPTQLKKLKEMYDTVPQFTNYATFLKESKAEIINICTPHALHAKMAIQAAEAGKHILVEKPMALTVKDCNEMIAAAKANQVLLMVVKQNRHNVPVKLTKNALETGKLGRVFMVECNVMWNRYEGYYSESPWRGRISEEGGALFTQASHFIDLLIWWFGPVVQAASHIETFNHKIEIEDCGNAMVQFESGVMGNLMWTTCVYNKNYEGSITIIGEYGTIKIGGQYLNKIEYWDVRAYPIPDAIQFNDKPNAYGKYQGTSSNHDFVLRDVVAKLRKGDVQVVTGEEGLLSVDAIEKMYHHTLFHP